MQPIIEFLFHFLGEYTFFKLITKLGREEFLSNWSKSSFLWKFSCVFFNLMLIVMLLLLLMITLKIVSEGSTSFK